MKKLLVLATLLLGTLCSQGARFSIIHWSDSHFLLGSEGVRSNRFMTACDWMLSVTNDGDINFKILIMTGDITEQSTNFLSGGTEFNATVCPLTTGTNRLWGFVRTNGINVWTCPGNHDCNNFNGRWEDGSLPPFQLDLSNIELAASNYFPLSFYTNQVGFVTNLTAMADTCVMSATNSGIELLWLPLDCGVTNIVNSIKYDFTAECKRQIDILKTYASARPNSIAIGGTHFILSTDTFYPRAVIRDDWSQGDPTSSIYTHLPFGRAVIDGGMLDINNLGLILCGHNRPLWSDFINIRGTNKNLVNISTFNMQAAGTDGAGQWNGRMLRIITFDTVSKMIYFRTMDLQTTNWITTPWYFTNGNTGFIRIMPTAWSIGIPGTKGNGR